MTLPSRLTIGTMNFGGRTPEAEAKRIVDFASERGTAFFDTANVYGDGKSEEILGRALKGRRDQVGIATKVGLLRRGGKPEGLSAERIPEALDESLRRLGTDRVELYYLHAPDHSTPLAETLDGVQQVLESGKAKSWGVSNFAAWQILELDVLCEARKLPKPAVSQVLYNLLVRQLDLEYFAFARKHPIHTTVYNPLAGGLLARDPGPGAAIPAGSRFESNKLYRKRYWSDPLAELTRRFSEVAASAGVDLITLAYAWLAGRPGVDSILTGPGSLPHLQAAFSACEKTLPAPVFTTVDEVYRAFVGTDACYAR